MAALLAGLLVKYKLAGLLAISRNYRQGPGKLLANLFALISSWFARPDGDTLEWTGDWRLS